MLYPGFLAAAPFNQQVASVVSSMTAGSLDQALSARVRSALGGVVSEATLLLRYAKLHTIPLDHLGFCV